MNKDKNPNNSNSNINNKIKKKKNKKLPFYIFLGHLDELTEKLGEDESNQIILEDKAWILVKNQGKRLIWIVESVVKNLKNSFMMYRDPQIYIFFNYHVKDMINNLEEELERAKTLADFRFASGEERNDSKNNITILGFNYNEKKIKMKKLRETVIEWCSKKNIPNYAEFELEEEIDQIFD